MSNTGLLVKGSYNNKMFSTFADEEVLEVLVKSVVKGESFYVKLS